MGAMRLGSAAAKFMQDADSSKLGVRGGSIIVMSSVAGVMPTPLAAPYCAAKHALHGFFGSLRAELAGATQAHNAPPVSVTLVCPGPVVSDGSGSAIMSSSSTCDTYTASTGVLPCQHGRMSSKRCAQLALAAGAAGQAESWMGPQPALALAYVSWLCPSLRNALAPTAAAVRSANLRAGRASLGGGLTAAILWRACSLSSIGGVVLYVLDCFTLCCCSCGCRRVWRALTCVTRPPTAGGRHHRKVD